MRPPLREVVGEFTTAQARLRFRVRATAPFVLPRHQQRHLWQAEQVLERLRGGR